MRPNGPMPYHRTLRSGRALKRAFTLVELLVVIAVIAILASILFPVFALARNSARRTVCASNLRQTGLAFSLYQQDNDGRFPTAPAEIQDLTHSYNYYSFHDGFSEGAVDGLVSWTELALPYVGVKAPTNQSATSYRPTSPIFFCPADTDPSGRIHHAIASVGTPSTSYAYKMWLATTKTEVDVPKPEQMAMLWEQKDFHMGGDNNDFSRASQMNVLFVDGHARWKRMADATTAALIAPLFGRGPNLNVLFSSPGYEEDYGADFIN